MMMIYSSTPKGMQQITELKKSARLFNGFQWEEFSVNFPMLVQNSTQACSIIALPAWNCSNLR